MEQPTPEDDGVDITLIDWMLSLTFQERLDALQGFVDSVTAFRGAMSRVVHEPTGSEV